MPSYPLNRHENQAEYSRSAPPPPPPYRRLPLCGGLCYDSGFRAFLPPFAGGGIRKNIEGESAMARILVTGGAGFIGSHVADHCIAAGHDTLIADNLVSGVRENVNPKADFHELDIRSEALDQLFEAEKPDCVIHLAAQIDVRKSVEDPVFDAEVNILGGLRLLENAVRHKVNRFIFSSTGGAIYGNPEELPASENCPPKPECHYATSKLAFEHYIELYQRLYDLEFVILRFPNVYGPRQRPDGEAGVCSILSGLMLQGKQPVLYGFGEPLRDYVYVGDIARGCLLAMEKGENAIINLGSGKGTSVRALFDVLKEHLGYEGEAKREPLRPGEVEKNYITGDRAAELLGWRPEIDLREGLRRTADHIRAEMA
jgi:UDP-glucose 4-epimerase